MQKRSDYNQDSSHYSKEYFLTSCAGAKNFESGKESHGSTYTYIFESMGIDVNNKDILDLGCGRGELCLSSIRRGANYSLGVDFSSAAIELAKNNRDASEDIDNSKVEFLSGNALELSLNKKFDIIFLTDIIEHLYDDQNHILFEKVYQHLKSDGKVVIHTMPTKEFIIFGQWLKFFYYLLRGRKFHRLTFAGQAEITHVNLFHKEQLARIMKDFNHKIWYDFADKNIFKRIVAKTPLIRLLSGNLWAVGTKK